jgi:hypothetical protein
MGDAVAYGGNARAGRTRLCVGGWRLRCMMVVAAAGGQVGWAVCAMEDGGSFAVELMPKIERGRCVPGLTGKHNRGGRGRGTHPRLGNRRPGNRWRRV